MNADELLDRCADNGTDGYDEKRLCSDILLPQDISPPKKQAEKQLKDLTHILYATKQCQDY